MAFPEHRIDYNPFGGQSYVPSDFKRLEVPFLQKLKNKQKN